jgi:uncharacterized iron-regulated membrane protein
MQAIRLSRKIHKWFALVIGAQLFLWALSGFYMVVVNIDIIHGDMLVKNLQSSIRHDDGRYVSLQRLATLHPDARSITLKSMMERPVYLVAGASTVLLDAVDGRQLSPLDKQAAMQIARFHYAGDGEIRNVELLEKNPPTELQTRPLPLWRVDFDDVWNSSFYIDPNSGEFKTRRHTLWRVFDFLWMLHIMDYDQREDINNSLMRIVSVLGVVLGLTGAWLLFYSFRRNRKQAATP